MAAGYAAPELAAARGSEEAHWLARTVERCRRGVRGLALPERDAARAALVRGETLSASVSPSERLALAALLPGVHCTLDASECAALEAALDEAGEETKARLAAKRQHLTHAEAAEAAALLATRRAAEAAVERGGECDDVWAPEWLGLREPPEERPPWQQEWRGHPAAQGDDAAASAAAEASTRVAFAACHLVLATFRKAPQWYGLVPLVRAGSGMDASASDALAVLTVLGVDTSKPLDLDAGPVRQPLRAAPLLVLLRDLGRAAASATRRVTANTESASLDLERLLASSTPEQRAEARVAEHGKAAGAAHDELFALVGETQPGEQAEGGLLCRLLLEGGGGGAEGGDTRTRGGGGGAQLMVESEPYKQSFDVGASNYHVEQTAAAPPGSLVFVRQGAHGAISLVLVGAHGYTTLVRACA